MKDNLTQKLNEIFDLTFSRLNIPLKGENANALQVAQIIVIKDFNEIINQYVALISLAGGHSSLTFETLRAYLDMLQLILTEIK